jgi:outer membrane protein assembly factor BamB
MHLWLQRIGGDISSPSDVSQGILQGAEGPSVLQASRTASTHRAACWRVLALSLVLPVTTARSEDWPTVLHDNQRTGVSGQTLRPPLHLLWTYASPGPPAPGWSQPVNGYGARKHRPDVAYDDAFRVIAVGDACYFCSSAENRIYALDAATGRIRWTRFTDAAPRLAPAYWQGRLYVGADDGIFRCLDAASGAVCWQIKARLWAILLLVADPGGGNCRRRRGLLHGRTVSRESSVLLRGPGR